MRSFPALALILPIGAAPAMGTGSLGPQEPEFTADFSLEDCPKLVPTGGNRYFPLTPGLFRRYEGVEKGHFVELEITVLNQTKVIHFEANGQTVTAKTRVVEERHHTDGELVEVSRNFFARCSATGDIFYFGEKVDIYENGEIVSHDGSWKAGQDDAQPGLIMPSLFLLGARYFQETAPDVALDRAEHLAMGFEFDTPAGVFENCVKIFETSALDPGLEDNKIYAPGVGLIADNSVELVEFDDGDN